MSSTTTSHSGRSGFVGFAAWKLWVAAWVVAGGYLLGGSTLFQRAEPAADESLAATEILQVTAASFVSADDATAPVTDDGSARPTRRTKNIEDIQVGDVVLAMDEHTGELQPKRVVQVFRNTSDHLRLLRLRSADAREQDLQTTDEHPFFANGRGWVGAAELCSGDEVVEVEGQTSTVVSTLRKEHPQGIAVFNFEVEDYHTYFVSQDLASAPIFVHNACRTTKTGTPRRPLSQHWKAQLNTGRTDLSPTNIRNINNRRSPRVDPDWVNNGHPGDSQWMGQTIELHHINYGPNLQEIPMTPHRGKGFYKLNHP